MEGAGRLVAPDTVEVDGERLHRPQRRPGHRFVLEDPARPGDRRRAGDHQRARAGPGPGARVGGRARRRRDRRRVRQRLEVLRRGRDHRRGAAPAGRRRGRGRAPRRWSGRSASGASTFKVGKPFEKVERTDTGVRVTIAGGETVEAELLLVAVGRGPTTANLGYEEQGVKHGPRLRTDRRAAAHQPAERLRGRRHRARPAARPPRLPAGHLRRRGDRRAATRR